MGGALVSGAVEAALVRFRGGARFARSTAPFLVDGAIDERALEALHAALASEPEAVAEAIARLVVDLGLAVDPQAWAGGNMIRDRRVIAVLASGLARAHGPARIACLDGLERHVPGAMLGELEGILVAELASRPHATLFLLAAKGKLPSAACRIRETAADPRWERDEAAVIARAAFGDVAAEGEILRPFTATTDPDAKARCAAALGKVGSERAIVALAQALRTPLTIEIPNVLDRSVRLDVIEALSHVFPDVQLLYRPSITSDDSYAAIEAWAEKSFGVTWSVPRPPFLTIAGYPGRRPS